MEQTDTLRKIQEVARKHFLAKGYKSASLRTIVSEAGFTLGAFYGYYATKEELFCALVEETGDGILRILSEITDRMTSFPENERVLHMTDCFLEKLPELVDYLLDHPDEVKLIVNCSGGTRYEGFMKNIQLLSMRHSNEFMEASRILKQPLQPVTYRILMNAYFGMLTETVLSGLTRDEILSVMKDIQMFYHNGIMGIITEEKQGE